MMIARRDRCAFTLIELIVVIGAIGLLLGMLLATLAAARERARSVRCMAQMRQIAATTLIYADLYQGHWPRSTHSYLAYGSTPWGYALMPQLGLGTYAGPGAAWEGLFNGLYRCPSDPRTDRWSYGKNVWYELNAAESGDVQSQPLGPTYWTIDSVPRPSAAVFHGELDSGSSADHIMAHFWLIGASPEVDDDRHRDAANLSFADGHVETHRLRETFDSTISLDCWNPGTAR